MNKVAYILGSLNRGGAETLLLDVFQNANLAPYQFIGIHRAEGVYQQAFYQTKVPLFYLSPRKIGIIRYISNLRRVLKNEHITIVHAQQAIDCIYCFFATFGLPIKVILTFHGFNYSKHWWNHIRYRLAIIMADKLCFVSNYQKNYYCHRYGIDSRKCTVVYNGIGQTKFDVVYGLPDFLSNHHDKVSLAMVGNFGSVRSQQIIIQAFALLKDRLPDVQMYFVGQRLPAEPYRFDNCQQLIDKYNLGDCVHLVGGRSDVPAILQHIDGFIYSSDHDTFGIAVIEALMNGLPVIVNDWAVMKEITHDGEWATLFRTGDPQDCADKIKDLIDHLPLRQSAAQRIAADVRREYSIEKHIEQLNKIYNQI